MAFEANMKALREVTQQLEQGELPLEEAVRLYGEGMALAAQCNRELQTAKLEITKQTVPTEDEREERHGNEA